LAKNVGVRLRRGMMSIGISRRAVEVRQCQEDLVDVAGEAGRMYRRIMLGLTPICRVALAGSGRGANLVGLERRRRAIQRAANAQEDGHRGRGEREWAAIGVLGRYHPLQDRDGDYRPTRSSSMPGSRRR